MSSVLVIFAHPAFQRSKVNRALIAAARNTEGVTVHDLYESYPDFLIDVSAEQQLLENHSTVVLQHPFYGYSSPALVKEWLDLVLEYGWAYGDTGRALQGKVMAQAISAIADVSIRSLCTSLPVLAADFLICSTANPRTDNHLAQNSEMMTNYATDCYTIAYTAKDL
jgi:hypothetical protein